MLYADKARVDIKEDLKVNLAQDMKEHVVPFTDVVKQQIEQEMGSRVEVTVRKELDLNEVQRTIMESKEHVEAMKSERAEQENVEARRCNVNSL